MQALNVLEVATALRHVWRAVRVDGATKTITHMRAMNDDEKMDLVREHIDLLRRSGAHTPTMNEVGLYLFILFYLFIYFFWRTQVVVVIYLFIYLFILAHAGRAPARYGQMHELGGVGRKLLPRD